LGLSVGVVAQKYVARRMGVGEGGIGKGKQKVESAV
jgi:DNA transposition AAA+ family ATPase